MCIVGIIPNVCLDICARWMTRFWVLFGISYLLFEEEHVEAASREMIGQIYTSKAQEVFWVPSVCCVSTWGQCGTAFLSVSFN